jgi:hypothetical protein
MEDRRMNDMANTYYSNWWYGVMIPVVFELFGWGSLWVASEAGLLREGASALSLLIPLITLLMAVILTPVFALCLFLDTRKIRRSECAWGPNPYLWGGAGLLCLAAIVSRFSLVIPLGLFYLYRRNTRVGLFSTKTDSPS